MPYLEPEHVLRQFASYLQKDVREAIDDEHRFVHAQVGSMSSSLTFLARELDTLDEDLEAQKQSLLDALDETEHILDGMNVSAPVGETVAEARSTVRSADRSDSHAFERELTGAATAVLDEIGELDEADARRAREPLYSFMQTRVRRQLEALGADREIA